MNTTLAKVIKGALGVFVLFFLLVTVNRWWSDYRESRADVGVAVTTSTPAPQQGKGSEAAPEPADKVSADKDDSKKPKTEAKTKTVVVLTQGLRFREEPDQESNLIRELDKGDKLVYIKTQGNWYQVQDDEGTRGWVSARTDYTRLQ